jgi:hypothetical protein
MCIAWASRTRSGRSGWPPARSPTSPDYYSAYDDPPVSIPLELAQALEANVGAGNFNFVTQG